MARISEFEGLRGFLAYWVVLGHVSNTLALDVFSPLSKDLSGRSAVVVFIVLSGFVITHLLLEKRERYDVFLLRRFLRLFPAYLVCLLASVALLDLAASALQLAPRTPMTPIRLEYLRVGRSELGWHVLAHLSMLHGLLDPVLPKATFTLLGQAWSVSVEWQFYVIAPLVVATFFTGNARAAVVLATLAAACAVVGVRGSGALPTHVAPFALGIGYCHLWRTLAQGRTRWSIKRVRAFSVGACALACLVSDERVALVVWCGVAHLVLLRAAVPEATFDSTREATVARFFASPWAQRLGALSYSVYLGHMIVLYPALLALARANASPSAQALGLVTSVVLGVWLLASVIHRYVEVPGIRLGNRLAARIGAPRDSREVAAQGCDGT